MEAYQPMFDAIFQAAKGWYRAGDCGTPIDFAMRMMDLPGVPMHCPEHHFIVPAALLLSAHRAAGSAPETVDGDLSLALARAKTVAGGFCGNCGCCGAAIGTGIFAAVWLKTAPRSGSGWADANRMTAYALERIASVEGPRCCKRVTFLALGAAMEFSRKNFGLELGEPGTVLCRYFPHNADCKREACPFFPRRRAD